MEEFWDRLYRGEECIWRGEKQKDDEENLVRAGGIVDGIDEFDNGFFHITKVSQTSFIKILKISKFVSG